MLPASTPGPSAARRGGAGAGAPSGREGDGAAAGPLSPPRLYDSHFNFVWRNLRRLGVPQPMVEDAAQDVFLVVHRRWASFDAGAASVETWLFGIVLRVARNHRRSLKRSAVWMAPSDGNDAVAAAESAAVEPADLYARREAAALLDRLLDTLDDDRRALLVLVDVEQMQVPAAASVLGINVNTAYWRLRTARKRLARALGRMKAAEAGRARGAGR